MNSKFKLFIVFLLLIVVGYLCYYIVINKDKNIVDVSDAIQTIRKEYKDKDYVFNTAYSSDDLVFPYINIDSTDARNINDKIRSLYEDEFNEISASNYKHYVNNEILSVIINVTLDGKEKYYTYNINMEKGKEITFEDVYYKYSKADLNLKDKITEYIGKNQELANKETIIDNSYNNYKVNAVENNVNFYLDGSNDLNVVIKIDLNEEDYEYAVFSM